MLEASLKKNDKRAYWVIGFFSVIVFLAVVALGKIEVDVDLGFDKHIFAKMNAVINSCVAILLVIALIAVRKKNYKLHRQVMFAALILSVFFLFFYIAHHLFAGETKFGGSGNIRLIYFVILISHIILAAIILPFILLTAYRALVADWPAHRKLARYTWPLWLYVAITGPIIYLMISPYYQG